MRALIIFASIHYKSLIRRALPFFFIKMRFFVFLVQHLTYVLGIEYVFEVEKQHLEMIFSAFQRKNVLLQAP